jgi:hypothetical protein
MSPGKIGFNTLQVRLLSIFIIKIKSFFVFSDDGLVLNLIDPIKFVLMYLIKMFNQLQHLSLKLIF